MISTSLSTGLHYIVSALGWMISIILWILPGSLCQTVKFPAPVHGMDLYDHKCSH